MTFDKGEGSWDLIGSNVFDEESLPDRDDYDVDSFDQYMNAEVVLPHKDSMTTGKVVGRRHDRDGKPIGKLAKNPILDTR